VPLLQVALAIAASPSTLWPVAVGGLRAVVVVAVTGVLVFDVVAVAVVVGIPRAVFNVAQRCNVFVRSCHTVVLVVS
jgi:hypothetical protein